MSTKTILKRIALVAVSAISVGLLSAPSSSAVTNPGNDPLVPFSKAAGTGAILTDSYLAVPGSYTATIAQSAASGNFVQFNATTDGASGATYTFASSGVGAISTVQSAFASWVFQDSSGTVTTGSLAGSTVSATGTTGRTFLASTVTGTLATPSTSVVNAAILYGVSGVAPVAANWAPWGAGNNAILYTVTAGGQTKNLYVALGGFAGSTGWSNAYFRVSVPSAGLTTVTITENVVNSTSGLNVATTREVLTIQGLGAAPANAYSFTDVTSGETNGYQPNAGGVIYAPASDVTNEAGFVNFEARGTNGVAITNPLLTPDLTVTITGVGSLAPVAPSSLQYTLIPRQTWTNGSVGYWCDGRPGAGKVTVKAGDVVAGSADFICYGKVSKIEASPIYTIGYADGVGADTGSLAGTANLNSELGIGAGLWFSPSATANDVAIAILATDLLGNSVPVNPNTFTLTNSNPNSFGLDLSTALVDNGIGLGSAGFGYVHAVFNTTGYAKSGDKGTFKLSYLNSDATVVTSNDINVTAGGSPATVTVTANKETYAPGEKGTLTTVVRDAAGNKVADSQFWSNFYAATPSVSGAFTWTTSVVAGSGGTVAAYAKGQFTVDGEWTSTFYAPIASGTYTIKATTGSDFVAAGRGVAKEVKIVVGADTATAAAQAAAEAATDAALEAIDAANAATDAANLAAEAADAATVAAEEARDAADAATAAVEALAQEVAALMAALKAQITTLANTVAKIAKKIKA